jgi:hypothetical protein
MLALRQLGFLSEAFLFNSRNSSLFSAFRDGLTMIQPFTSLIR